MKTILTIIICLFLLSCIPKIPDQVIEEVRACYVAPVIPKSKLPTVKYTKVLEYKCFADSEQEQNAVKREVLLKMDSNNCRDQYEDARDRCNKEGQNE